MREILNAKDYNNTTQYKLSQKAEHNIQSLTLIPKDKSKKKMLDYVVLFN